MEDLTGKQLGPYQIIAALGEGGMAAVYKAYQPAMDRYVALKILPRHFASDPNFVARFQQEAKVLARLVHPHILSVHDFGEADGYTYIVMPFVESGTLTDLLTGQPLPLKQIRNIISQVGDALDYAHARGLVHRDVKPSNVLIDQRGNCLLTDFGLAKIVEGNAHLTTSGTVVGTPAYMSPEQGLGQPLDGRSDIYSLGVILYEMATGRPPYNAETPMAVVIKHIHDPLPPPRTVVPALPEAVERVILKALAKNAGDRFATAGEMVRALQAAIPETASDMLLEAGLTVKGAAVPPAGQPPTAVGTAKQAQVETAPAAPARPSPPWPMWQPVLLSALGWDVGIGLGAMFGSVNPGLGGLVAGAIGGLSLALAWRRIEPSVTRRRVLALAAVWAIGGAVGVIAGPGFFIVVAIAGLLTGLVLRRAESGMTWKRVAAVAGGWFFGWLLGGILFAVATQVAVKPLSGLMVLFSFTLAEVVGSWIMFGQFKRARRKIA